MTVKEMGAGRLVHAKRQPLYLYACPALLTGDARIMAKATEGTTVVAFAIDEQIRWGCAKVNEHGLIRKSVCLGVGKDIEATKEKRGDIAPVRRLSERDRRKIFGCAGSQRIGVSVIGPVNVKEKTVSRVARKAWKPPPGSKPVLAFNEIFSSQGFDIGRIGVEVQNDATCAALAEWYFHNDYKEDDKGRAWRDTDRRLYVTFNDGVNCGLIHYNRSYFEFAHPEMGHTFPRLHPFDVFDPQKHSGCTSHRWCFEGIASGVSLRKRWGKEWESNAEAWRLQAYYAAQLVLDGMLAFSPDIIILGGYVVHKNPDFLPMVRHEFAALNAGYIDDERTRSLDRYIVAGHRRDEANILGALVLAAGNLRPRAVGD